MNIIVNAHAAALPRSTQPTETPVISAMALRVRDARRGLPPRARPGAWAVPTHVEVMELNIPAIHGVGASRIYFVDRYQRLLDLRRRLHADSDRRPASAGDGRPAFLRHRAVHRHRPHRRLDGVLPRAVRLRRRCPTSSASASCPRARILRARAARFYLQLIEPDAGRARRRRRRAPAAHRPGHARRAGGRGGAAAARRRFVESQAACTPSERGALTQTSLGGVMFELVHQPRADGRTMSRFAGNIDDFGMDTISLAGPLPAKLQRDARRRLHAGHAVGARHRRPCRRRRRGGAAVRASGLRVTGFQVLRDFEGLSGHLHDYKVDIAKSMLEMCRAARLRRCCWSARRPRCTRPATRDAIARDLRKLAMLARAARHQGRLRGLVVGPHDQRVHRRPGTSSAAPTCPTSASASTRSTSSPPRPTLDDLEYARPGEDLPGAARRLHVDRRSARSRSASTTARHFRVFPGEGVHSEQVADAGACGSTGSATAATTASRSSTTTTSSCRCRPSPQRAQRSARVARRGRAAPLGAAARPDAAEAARLGLRPRRARAGARPAAESPGHPAGRPA